MLDSNYIDVLQKIYNQLKNSDINWVVTGSPGFSLHGLEVEIHDIDIQTDKLAAYEIEHRFSNFVVKNVIVDQKELIESHIKSENIIERDGLVHY